MFAYNSIYIRAIEKEDLKFLSELRNHHDTWLQLGTLNFTNEIKQLEWFKNSSLDNTKAYFILCLFDTTPMGFVRMDEIDHVNKSIRVGGDIHPTYRGLGYGTRMYELLFKYCFKELNMNRVWLLVLDSNHIARQLYKKMGMKEEGCQREAIFRDGKYRDYIMMSILRSEWKED